MTVTLKDLIPECFRLRRNAAVWLWMAAGLLLGTALLFIPH
jgi:hypothetical protein